MRMHQGWFALCLVCVPAVARAAPPVRDPDWPCVQRLVPNLTASNYWSDPITAPDWHSNPRIAALVAEIGPRSVPADQGVKTIGAFVTETPPPERASDIPAAFAGLVDNTNRQRGEVIDRLRQLSRRQHEVGDIVSRATAELRALPADVPAAKRDEVTERRGFLIREFDETERTMRYACEIPVQLEARLGEYARALQQGRN